jgi:hypothetical protein
VTPTIVLLGSLLAHGDAGKAWTELGRWLDREPAQAKQPHVKFYLELFALARCEPAQAGEVPDGDVWNIARAHARLERLRLARVKPAWAQKLRWDAPQDAGAVAWPTDAERWPGEKPVVVARKGHCDDGAAKEDFESESQAVAKLVDALPENAPTRGAVLLELALLDSWHARDDRAERALAAIDEAQLLSEELRDKALLDAIVAERRGQKKTEKLWARAKKLGQPSAFVDAHLVAAALREDDVATARTVAESRAVDSIWFASRAAVAAFRQDDEAAFFAAARRVLGTRAHIDVKNDPMLRDVADLAALRLAQHPFDDKAIELAESLGPPRELDDRIDAAAEAALRTGRTAYARAAWTWLLGHAAKGSFQIPYYSARLCVTSLAANDTRTFMNSYVQLADHALAQSPRRKRPLEWDRQLLFATRDALPLAVAQPDRKVLAQLVGTLQTYLRDAGPERSYAELTELYRAASAQLPLTAGARPYAEKLGAKRAPLVLGEVQVAAAHDDVPVPAELAVPRVYGARTLLCFPDGNLCPRWAGPEVK